MESSILISKEKVGKKQINPVNKYNIIKSNYFLQKVFNNLEKKRILYITKYNKKIKKRINININDYKEYSEKYSSIEIEIKTFNDTTHKFININEEDEKNYHIYFNNNKKK